MTSHREAPSISKDPVADNTDVYAFVSPDRPETVTLIANYIPLEEPAGGPNFYQFGDDVLYEIKIDNDGDGIDNISYQFRFKTVNKNPNTFLYNTGPITSLNDPNWNVRQFYDVTKVTEGRGDRGNEKVLGKDLATPPNRIGPRSTPNYPALANAAIHTLSDGVKVFASQRDEGFYVDLGSIFDLGTLRPFQDKHLIPTPAAAGKDGTKGFNVHTIALQIPKRHLTNNGSNPTDPTDTRSTIGVYASASRRKVTILQDAKEQDTENDRIHSGPFVQVSRLGEPLINEVIIPLKDKDFWNRSDPVDDKQFLKYYSDPQLQNLLPVLYPGVFPNLANLLTQSPSSRPRSDLVAILLTGIPRGVVPGFPGNFTGSVQADLLRLNMAIAPTVTDANLPVNDPRRLGLLGGDIAGFPNGRRVFDDVIDIELRAVAGAIYNLVNHNFIPDPPASLLADSVTKNDLPYLNSFPYLGHPHEGYEHSHD